jgi:hypothetical protein
MLSAREIIGFATAGFELIAALRQQRQVEITRLTEIAARLRGRFCAETAVGFLYYEILGRPPDREDLLGYTERLHRAPSVVSVIVEELVTLAAHSNERSRSR